MEQAGVHTITSALDLLNLYLFNPIGASGQAVPVQEQVQQALTRLDRRISSSGTKA
jgi:hypothetical protein